MSLQPNRNLSGMMENCQEKNLAGPVSIATIELSGMGKENGISLSPR